MTFKKIIVYRKALLFDFGLIIVLQLTTIAICLD
jgi:hypothetical protein